MAGLPPARRRTMRQARPHQARVAAPVISGEDADLTAFDAHHATLTLLAARAPEATVCPSEVARLLATTSADEKPGDWRVAMPQVHAAVDALLAEGQVQLSWKGTKLKERRGPYRISRGAHE